VTFCWYGPYEDGSDEVTAWGEKWAPPQDSAEKVMDVHTAIRCVKKMKVCLKSATHNIGGKPITNIEILPVKSWSAQQITADMEDQLDPCEKDSYIINKLDRRSPTYVAQRLMWRSPRDARRDTPFRPAKRHIT
jgi:hypothetical protein